MDFYNVLSCDLPAQMCLHCLAIIKSCWDVQQGNHAILLQDDHLVCPVCQTEYELDENGFSTLPLYHDPIEHMVHGALLGGAATTAIRRRKANNEKVNYFRTLTYLLARAEHFVSFTSWRIDPWFLGAFAVAAQRGIRVYGIVTGMKSEWDIDVVSTASQVLDLPESINVRTVTQDDFSLGLGTHSKMINVDGVFLLYGSTNLHVKAWEHVSKMQDNILHSCDPSFILDFHNQNFAPVWEKLENTTQYPKVARNLRTRERKIELPVPDDFVPF